MEGSAVTGLGSLDFAPVITALTSAVTPAQIISLLASRSAVMGGSIVV